jgi:hypothetical protein
MKKFLLLALLVPMFAHAQKLTEEKKDEFTGAQVKRTDYEQMVSNMKFTFFYRFSKIDTTYFLDLKMMIGSGKVFSISQGNKIMFKMEDSTIITIENIESSIACKGCGAKGFSGSAAYGVGTSYVINQAQLEKLTKLKLIKYRIYTSEGYIEDEAKESKAETFLETAKLIL